MGVMKLFSGGWDGVTKNNTPDMSLFYIVRNEQVGKNVIAEIRYPHCKNFDGRKILVYLNMTIDKLWDQKELDPHFCVLESAVSPFARFEPTPAGWEAAKYIAQFDWTEK